MLDLLHKHLDSKGKQAKLKSPQELQDLLDVTRTLLADFDDRKKYPTDTSEQKTDLEEVREKFRIVKVRFILVLCVSSILCIFLANWVLRVLWVAINSIHKLHITLWTFGNFFQKFFPPYRWKLKQLQKASLLKYVLSNFSSWRVWDYIISVYDLVYGPRESPNVEGHDSHANTHPL